MKVSSNTALSSSKVHVHHFIPEHDVVEYRIVDAFFVQVYCGKAIHYNVKVDINAGASFQPNSFDVAAHLDFLYHRIVRYPVKNPDAAICNIVMPDMGASRRIQ